MTTNNENRTGKPDEGAAESREEKNKKTNSDHSSNDDRPRRPYSSEGSQDRPRRPYSSEGSQDRPRRPYSSEGSQDRPRRSYGDQGNSFGSDRPRRSYDNDASQDRPRRPYNPEGSQERPRRSYGDQGNSFGSYGSDRPRRSFGNEGSQDRPRRPYSPEGSQDRPRRSYGDQGNSFGGYGSDRPRRSYSNEGSQDRPRRSYGNEGYQDRSRPRSGFNESPDRLRPDGKPKRPRIKKSSSDGTDYSTVREFSVPKYAPNLDPDTPIRLNKFLSNAGICSRREADEFIQAGVVKVNGEVASELGVKIKLTDEVMFHDQPVNIERKVYVLLNKPKDCVTTSDDPQERLTVMDLVKNACRERIYPVGRLDRNTTGVLLLTNDGDLASKLSHPKYEKRKIYQATLDKDLTEEDMQKVAKGIVLDDEKIAVDEISFVSLDQKNVIGIEIHSGQNRVVRRIFEQVGYKVYKLDRVYFAGLTKKNLPRGRWRYLSDKEVSLLKMGAFV
ncbi:MAG: pseudouridine synthase [Bacteroidales bacterium]|nr:pseudouridine synthase [Bacteroidales bacterium]